MAASPSLNNHHFQFPDPAPPLTPRKHPCKSFTNFIITLLVLAILPLFPSEAPQFINQTPFINLWDLLYLFFIGIVVCYGLFSRTTTTVKVNNEICPNLGNVKMSQFWSPLNGISHISSIFENGFENSSGFDELRISQVFSPFHKGLYPNGVSVDNDSGTLRSLVSNGGFGDFSGSNREKVSRGLSLQDFVGESMALDQVVKHKLSIGYKPLGLPVRSLRSGNLDSYRLESSNGCENAESVVRGLVPTNLEGKFKEEVAPSPIPWRSRSSRMEMSTIKSPSHFRPTSSGDIEFEPLKSQSFRPLVPSQSSFKHSSSGAPSFASIPVELPKPKMEDLKGKEKEKFDGSQAPKLQPKLESLSGDSLTRSSNSRHLSIGSTSVMNVQIGSKDEEIKDFRKGKKGKILNAMMQDLKGKEKFNGPKLQPKQKQPSLNSSNGDTSIKNSYARSLSMGSSAEVKVNGVENYLKDFLERKEDNVLGTEKNAMDFSKLSQKPTDLISGGYTPGKSVRTIRSSEKVVEDNKETRKEFPSSIDNMLDMKLENMPKDKIKGNLDDVKEIKLENIQMSSDKEEEADSVMLSDAEPHSGEVDRRADEFIAKFKEQIRLQKVASRRSS